MDKWQMAFTVAAGAKRIVPIPSGVGKVQVALDWAGSGTGTAVQSKYTKDEAIADTDSTQWIALTGAISGAGADAVGVTSEYASAVKLSAATTAQRFVLLGERASG